MENVDPNRFYTMNHPALDPLESRLDNDPAAAVNVGEPIHDNHIEAAILQHKHREDLMKVNLATAREVVVSEKRKTRLVLEHIHPIAAGPEFGQHLLQQMQDMNRQMVERDVAMNRRFAAMNQRMDEHFAAMNQRMDERDVAMNRRDVAMNQRMDGLSIEIARNTNRNLHRDGLIVPVRNVQGNLPPVEMLYPQQYRDIWKMNGRSVDALFVFYRIAAPGRPTLDEKQELLSIHLGFPPRA
jgi:predicted exporter